MNSNDFGIGSLLAACVVALAGAWALVKFVAYDTLVKEIHSLREVCESNVAKIEKLNNEIDHWQQKYYELHQEYTSLQGKYNVLSGKHEQLQREFDRLREVK